MKRMDSARLAGGLALLLGGSGCAAEISDGSEGAGSGSESFVNMDNGLEFINGLTINNGLAIGNGLTINNGLSIGNGLPLNNGLSIGNGLTINNGLPTQNGVVYINGLATHNGVAIANGVLVDCTNGTPGQTCTGLVDGLLSPVTGLLKNDIGKLTAAYLAKCALAEGDAIKVQDYTGNLVTLVGALGLAPAWRNEVCGPQCQESISACLMALTNGAGEHVQIEMRSTNAAIGQGGTYRYQEAAFYGNIFESPPSGAYCVGKDFAGLLGTNILSPQQRACESWMILGLDCPYRLAGNCTRGYGFPIPFGKAACAFSGDSATACSTPNSSVFKNYNNGDRKWTNVITTYRNSKM